MKLKLIATTCAVLFPILANAQVPHPNYDCYEYRRLNWAFVYPYLTYPEGMERGAWKCFDGTSRSTTQCSFYRGDLSSFQFIYKPKPRQATANPPVGLALGIFGIHSQNRSSSGGSSISGDIPACSN